MPDLRVLGGRYQLVERVGRGGMGAVWRARDQLLGRDVAVKEILLPHGLDDEQLAAVRGRALREARAAAQVRHPAVVTIHDVVMEGDHPWIVMDFVRARSLADRIEDGDALRVPEVARIGEALVGALQAIHGRGIVHRDLKPANVLIDADGQVVLTDFGIATIEGDARFTASGLLIGTPGFMAPERLSGEPAGPPSDLWALGAVLYAAVEGCGPYEGSTPMVIASAVLTKEPRRPQRAGPLAPLLAALLARNPADRPDARHVAGRLAALARTPDTRSVNPPTRQEANPGFGGPGVGPAAWPPRPPGGPPAGPVQGHHPPVAPPPDAVRARRRWPIPAAALIVVLAATAAVVWYVISRPTIDPCGLVTADQAKRLVPVAHRTFRKAKPPTDTDDCYWDQSDETSLIIGVATYSTVAKATAALHNREEDTYGDDTALRISGIGDEVHEFDDQLTHSMAVLFRRNRHYAIVTYGGIGSVQPKTTEQSKVLQAARWVDARLAAMDR